VTNGTFIVSSANGYFNAFNNRISSQSWWTGTFWSMIEWNTLSVDTASTTNTARISALFGITFMVKGAVFITSTTTITFAANANLTNLTLLVRRTFVFGDAFALNTCLMFATVSIMQTDQNIR